MPNSGTIRLFRVLNINVYLHWLWLLMAYYQVFSRQQDPVLAYSRWTWAAAEYVGLFVIVLLHEFGHALACRSVGGTANRIVLWPLGGVAFVSPPARPGALLWSIAAGPLVNLLLIPVTLALAIAVGVVWNDGFHQITDIRKLFFMLAWINVGLFVFNMLPVYPLDGGQILQSILWFFMKRSTSIAIAAGIGLICAVLGGLFALQQEDIWLGVMAIFVAMQAFQGLRIARALRAMEKADRERVNIEPWAEISSGGNNHGR
ncbi:MAG: site-2 protease family protein [Phycisphaeraceae bacterium]|nr:site-2 protease family protein [Phycisphaeraceae bacterium]